MGVWQCLNFETWPMAIIFFSDGLSGHSQESRISQCQDCWEDQFPMWSSGASPSWLVTTRTVGYLEVSVSSRRGTPSHHPFRTMGIFHEINPPAMGVPPWLKKPPYGEYIYNEISETEVTNPNWRAHLHWMPHQRICRCDHPPKLTWSLPWVGGRKMCFQWKKVVSRFILMLSPFWLWQKPSVNHLLNNKPPVSFTDIFHPLFFQEEVRKNMREVTLDAWYAGRCWAIPPRWYPTAVMVGAINHINYT